MRVVFRVDASARIGGGHLLRCLALGEALRARGARVELASLPLGAFQRLVEERGFSLLPLSDVEDAALGGGPVDWLVVDHYALDRRWESALRGRVGRILVIDDLADRAHDCDVLLDQNYAPEGEGRYRALVPEGCALLLGPRFALLRPEFRTLRAASRDASAPVRRVLVSFGAAFAGELYERALQAIPPGAQIDVAAGWDAAAAASLPNCTVHPPARLAELMGAADLAIGAGGITTWERCCLGLPSIVIASAPNQERGSRALAEDGVILYLGGDASAEGIGEAVRLLTSNAALRVHLSRASRALVDGAGVERVADAILPVELQVRPAAEADCDAVYRWRNDPATRAQSFNERPLVLDEHRAWFHKALGDPNRVLLIGELEGVPVGVVRFDVAGQAAAVSIFLDPARQGRGLGPGLLRAGGRWLAARRPEVRRVRAEVRGANAASRRAFLKAGYQEAFRTYEEVVGNDDDE